MIELNCSYEQSKKILDLGYDFTFICRDFELREEKEITKFVLVEKHDDGLVSLWDCGERKTYIYSTKSWWIIPIVPKAALEACLPTTLSFGFNEDVYLMYEYCDKEFQYYKSPDYYCSDSKTYYSSKSAYEAFMWCHENYPKELKKKFKEVMG